MIERYSLPEMKHIWSDEEKVTNWLKVELLVLEALQMSGIVPARDLWKIRQNVKVNPASPKELFKYYSRRSGVNMRRIKEIEKTTRHDLAAFVDQISEGMGKESRWLHYGLTSSDILDTATGLQLKKSCLLLLSKLKKLKGTLKKLSLKYKKTLMIGRTHGV
ncbi:MAG: lyase family protein, partial [Elusimicrobiota bacterium]